MNPNLKGTIGELAVTQDLLEKGYFVFGEVTKHSKVDMIAVTSDYSKILKIQVKSVMSDDDKVTVGVRKCCLDDRYNSVYQKGQNDYYAIYVIDKKIVFYIPEDLFLDFTSSITFLLDDTKKGRHVKDFGSLT